MSWKGSEGNGAGEETGQLQVPERGAEWVACQRVESAPSRVWKGSRWKGSRWTRYRKGVTVDWKR